MKTVRFKEIVARCGAPSPHLFWGPPDKDQEFQSALKNGRVLTVHQELHGGKKDSGSVGFISSDRHAQVLLFPKSLRRFAATKVVAIDFDLLAKEPAGRSVKTTSKWNASAATKSPQPKPKAKTNEERSSPAAHSTTAASPPPQSRKEKIEPAPTPSPKTIPREKPSLDASVSAEIKKALRELKAGKTVAAYERLSGLVK